MGHVPSAEYVTQPFVLDMFSTKNSCERLVALALTKHNFPSPDDPLFLKFCAVRAENPVRHWYCRPKELSMEDLPEVPSPEELYQRFVEGATAVCALNLPPERWTPLPIMLVKLDDPTSNERPNGENCTVVGYFGCRGFSSLGVIGDECVLGIFLSTRFYNEAKSLSSIQLACKCFRYFCLKAGCKTVPWPPSIRYDTFQSNLPCLRLTQKLHSLVEAHGVDTEKGTTITKENNRAFFVSRGEVVRPACEKLAERITETIDASGHHYFALRPESIPQPSLTSNVKELNALITDAKARWSDANAAVVRSQLQQSRQTRKDRHDEIQANERLFQDGGQGTANVSAARSRKGSTSSRDTIQPAGRNDSPRPAPSPGNRRSSGPSSGYDPTPASAQPTEPAAAEANRSAPARNRRSSAETASAPNPHPASHHPTLGRTVTPPSVHSSPAKGSGNSSVSPQAPAVLPGLATLPIGVSLVGPPSPNSSMVGHAVHSMNSSIASSNASLAGMPVFQGEQPAGPTPECSQSSDTGHSIQSQSHHSSAPHSSPITTPQALYSPYPQVTSSTGSSELQPLTSPSSGYQANSAMGFYGTGASSHPTQAGAGSGRQYAIAHYPRETVPLQRTMSNAALESTQPWQQYQTQLTYTLNASLYPQHVDLTDFRVFLGERTPVYVCTNRRQWEPLYWRNPLSPLRRSTWQPHLEDGFVCFECDHMDLLLFDPYWRPIVQPSEALLFVEAKETLYTLDESGNYVAGYAK